MIENIELKPYKESEEGKKEQVKGMFDNISRSYDEVNRVMTFRMDISWRENVVKMVREKNPKEILDVATGTGDLAIFLSQIKEAKITGVDISEGMLKIGREKINKLGLGDRIGLMYGDSEELNFENGRFDCVTVSYGVRNFEDLEKGLLEIKRVLKEGGRLVILETSVPENAVLRFGYKIYTKYILPFIGGMISRDKKAYSYLSESAEKFPYGKKFVDILKNVGFRQVSCQPQNMGVSTIYIADK